MLDNTPILHEDIGNDTRKILKNGPQCVAFGIFIIWFSSITLNLGPTFLSGAIASGYSKVQPSCPLVQVHDIIYLTILHSRIICWGQIKKTVPLQLYQGMYKSLTTKTWNLIFNLDYEDMDWSLKL